jgi:outer membrane protein
VNSSFSKPGSSYIRTSIRKWASYKTGDVTVRGIELRRRHARYARSVASLLFVLVAGGLPAQETPPARLSLEEAIALARRNNPEFQAQKNDAAVAEWAVRGAYGDLLPGVSASTSLSYQASGTPRFGIFSGSDLGLSNTPSYYSSDYFVGLNYSLSGSSLLAPGREKSTRRATEAGIVAADFLLQANVTRQYLAVLRARDAVALAQEELKRADETLKLAQAKVAVGAAIPLEAKQAEVERGRAEVTLLQSRNLVQTETLRLMQQLGIELSREVELTTRFDVFDVAASQEDLVRTALDAHPQLTAARAAEQAGEAGVKMAKSAYLPNLDFSAGLSGYTRQAGSNAYLLNQAQQQVTSARQECENLNLLSERLTRPLPGFPQNCSLIVLTPDREREVLAQNNVFPFDFTRQPWSAQMRVSLPVFQGFRREQQIEQAKAAAADARFRSRGEELRLKTEIASAYTTVATARQTVALEQRNRELADEQLTLARERYRVGVATFLELQEAETIKARADRAYLIALYSFHEGIAALETAVGRNLRPVGETR